MSFRFAEPFPVVFGSLDPVPILTPATGFLDGASVGLVREPKQSAHGTLGNHILMLLLGSVADPAALAVLVVLIVVLTDAGNNH